MQIQLKQPEIEAALKMYIANQGISLAGKSFTVSFTSGRKENGLSADLVIEDQAIPGFTDTYALHPVNTTNVKPLVSEAASEPVGGVVTDAEFAQTNKPKLFS